MSDFNFVEWIEQVVGVGESETVPEDWSDRDRKIFKGVYESMINDQNIFKHPLQPSMPQEMWKTICWNAAWVAADESLEND